MPFIHRTNFIAAPAERVFDLSRHLSVHKISMSRYSEKIIGGKTSGLLELNEEVQWQAKHIFVNRQLRVRMTVLKYPSYFLDEQVSGDFKLMRHEHYFKPVNNGTLMIDQLKFETPYGIFGVLINNIFLTKYLRRLLNERNAVIRRIAESNQWKQYLDL